jgi:hypothetical protein
VPVQLRSPPDVQPTAGGRRPSGNALYLPAAGETAQGVRLSLARPGTGPAGRLDGTFLPLSARRSASKEKQVERASLPCIPKMEFLLRSKMLIVSSSTGMFAVRKQHRLKNSVRCWGTRGGHASG